eukprot:975679_1
MSRLGHGLRGATRRMSFQSSFKPSFSSNYTRFASASSFTQSTKSAPTMTMSYPQTMSAMTPSCMVFSSISLTPNMEQGSHLIGLGSTSSALSEEEEEDDAIEMIKASQRTVYSILCIQYLALFMVYFIECNTLIDAAYSIYILLLFMSTIQHYTYLNPFL